MRRDMDLLRSLLLKLESASERAHAILVYQPGELAIDGYTADQVAYHFKLAVEAGLVDQGGRAMIFGMTFRSLTWEGHDFVDSVRDDEIWRRTKSGAASAGGFSVDLLKDLARGFIRKKVAEHTGIDL